MNNSVTVKVIEDNNHVAQITMHNVNPRQVFDKVKDTLKSDFEIPLRRKLTKRQQAKLNKKGYLWDTEQIRGI